MGVFKGKIKNIVFKEETLLKKWNWGFLLITAIIIGSFVIAPIIPSFLGNSSYTFGYYKSTPIEFFPGSDLQREVSNLSQNLPSDILSAYRQFYTRQIWYTAFMRQAMRLAIEDQLKQSKLTISQEATNNLMKAYEGFFNKEGHFDLTVYNKYKSDQKALIQKELVKGELWKKFLKDNTDLPLSPSFENWLSELSQKIVDVSWVVFDKDDFPVKDIQRYKDEHNDLFQLVDWEFVSYPSFDKAQTERTFLLEGKSLFDDISSDQKKLFSGYMIYEILDLLEDANKEKAKQDFFDKSLEFSSIILMKDKTYGFFFKKGLPRESDLSQKEIRDKIILNIQLNSGDWYQTILQNLAKSGYLNKPKKQDRISFNPEGSHFYLSDMGSLATFAGNPDFYKMIFSLPDNLWSEPFVMGDSVYRFLVKSEQISQKQDSNSLKEKFKEEITQEMEKDLLDKRFFKDNFSQTYPKLGLDGKM